MLVDGVNDAVRLRSGVWMQIEVHAEAAGVREKEVSEH
jgi:hypothetical protein